MALPQPRADLHRFCELWSERWFSVAGDGDVLDGSAAALAIGLDGPAAGGGLAQDLVQFAFELLQVNGGRGAADEPLDLAVGAGPVALLAEVQVHPDAEPSGAPRHDRVDHAPLRAIPAVVPCREPSPLRAWVQGRAHGWAATGRPVATRTRSAKASSHAASTRPRRSAPGCIEGRASP